MIFRQEPTQDDSTDEGTHHHVNPEISGDNKKEDEQQERNAHRGLRGGAMTALQVVDDLRCPEEPWHYRNEDRDTAEECKGQHRCQGTLRAEEECDRQNGAELTPGPGSHEHATERSREFTTIAQHGKKGAQRSTGEHDGEPNG